MSIPRSTFQDRTEAGKVLAGELSTYTGRDDVVVLGLARGGVPVAAEVATALSAPLDVFVVRKLGVPDRPELAMGAIADGGIRVLNLSVVRSLGISDEAIEEVAAREASEVARRLTAYRGEGRAPLDLDDQVAIVVDDGLATGATMKAAVTALRGGTGSPGEPHTGAVSPALMGHPRAIVVAAPVGARETCRELAEQADEVVCAMVPMLFQAVGQWYRDFSPPTDEQIRALLGF